MMAKNIPKMPLPKLDDLFTTEEERTNDKLEKVIDIKISDIDDFPDHPFKVIENEDMYNMLVREMVLPHYTQCNLKLHIVLHLLEKIIQRLDLKQFVFHQLNLITLVLVQ